MASLNLSTNGPSITKSYQSIINSGPPSGPAANSQTYGQWAIFSVSAPLVNAFQQDAGGKESALKVQSTGEGELVDLIDEFSDGRVQFAFVKVKDPNTTLPKYALIGWCGEGVPERTKGYFTSHVNAVTKVLHGYHVQITARSDRDLTPEGIVQKISDASGSKYSGGSAAPATSSGPAPPVASKPVFTPTQSSGGAGGFNPLSKRTPAPKPTNLDEDGWGEDAPQVTRTQLEKVTSAYQPTKVIMRDLSSKQEPSRDSAPSQAQREAGDVVKGAYQPVGKVDIAAIRRQAQSEGKDRSDRPAPVKGSYEPVGKVDIAAIRARAQPSAGPTATPPSVSPVATGDAPRSFGTATIGSERLTSLPKPKVANRFGAGTSTFTGTKPPAPGGFGIESKQSPKPPVGASRTFADEGGKTPAQLWAEKKAREGGASASSIGVGATPVAAQQSGNEGWKSGYTGKSWGSVQTTRTGQSAASVERQSTSQEEEPETAVPSGGVGAMRDMFKGAPPMGAAAPVTERSAPSPPPLATSTKPNAGGGVPIPGLPTRPAEQEEPAAPRLPSPPPQPRSPTPPTPVADSSSPIRLAMPVSSNQEPQIEDAREEQFSPPPAMPVRSMAREVAQHDEPDEPDTGDMARAAGTNVAANSFGQEAVDQAPGNTSGGKRALIQYDYEKAEDNELELVEGDYVTNIEMVDDDWWMGQNSRGESGLFPSNYVELVDDDDSGAAPAASHAQPDPVPVPAAAPPGGSSKGATATALYDYEAAEDNEITFPEDAKITNIEFPDDDWWSGEYNGKQGLFPANYVQLDQ